MPTNLRALVLFVALVSVSGCKLMDEPRGRSPLLPVASSADAVTLEIFAAPVSQDDSRLATLWKEVDEQCLPAELRKKLAQNGFQAGVVGPNVPDVLAELLKVTDRQIPVEERTRMPLETEPGVALLIVQPRAGERRDLVTSP